MKKTLKKLFYILTAISLLITVVAIYKINCREYNAEYGVGEETDLIYEQILNHENIAFSCRKAYTQDNANSSYCIAVTKDKYMYIVYGDQTANAGKVWKDIGTMHTCYSIKRKLHTDEYNEILAMAKGALEDYENGNVIQNVNSRKPDTEPRVQVWYNDEEFIFPVAMAVEEYETFPNFFSLYVYIEGLCEQYCTESIWSFGW